MTAKPARKKRVGTSVRPRVEVRLNQWQYELLQKAARVGKLGLRSYVAGLACGAD